MSLGIRLLANVSRPLADREALIVRIEIWLRHTYPEIHPKIRRAEVDSTPTLFAQIHPAAEELELSFPSPSQIVASANTTTVGPGYHIFLTELLKNLAKEFGAEWTEPADDAQEYGDETGYFFSGDTKRLYDEMTEWLSALANLFFDGSLDSDSERMTLCLPMNPQFRTEQPALTPLGPRDRDWLKRTSQDGFSGKDFFAWWTPGVNAEYYRGRALAQMWVEVRWRRPRYESESATLEDVADSLRHAFELDPSLEYPWAEWKQILDLLDRDGTEALPVTSVAYKEPLIGYRRNDVTVTLPGRWTIRIPGSFTDFTEDEQGDYSAVDPPREIWFTAYRYEGADPAKNFQSAKKKLKKDKSDYVIERDDYFAQATIRINRRVTGEPYYVLNSSNLAPGARSVCTILFSGPEGTKWAVETWQSLQPPSTSEA